MVNATWGHAPSTTTPSNTHRIQRHHNQVQYRAHWAECQLDDSYQRQQPLPCWRETRRNCLWRRAPGGRALCPGDSAIPWTCAPKSLRSDARVASQRGSQKIGSWGRPQSRARRWRPSSVEIKILELKFEIQMIKRESNLNTATGLTTVGQWSHYRMYRENWISWEIVWFAPEPVAIARRSLNEVRLYIIERIAKTDA